MILFNHYFITLKLFRAIKGFILYQIKQTVLKSGHKFTSYGKFTDTRCIEKIANSNNPSLIFRPLAQYLGSDKATGFEALPHICV